MWVRVDGCRHILVPLPSTLHPFPAPLVLATYNENPQRRTFVPSSFSTFAKSPSLSPLQLSFTVPTQPTIPFTTTMSFARTSTQALRLRAAPAVRSNLRTRGTGYRFNSSNAGPNAQANMHPAVAGAAAGAGAAVLIGYGAYKYTVSLATRLAWVYCRRWFWLVADFTFLHLFCLPLSELCYAISNLLDSRRVSTRPSRPTPPPSPTSTALPTSSSRPPPSPTRLSRPSGARLTTMPLLSPVDEGTWTLLSRTLTLSGRSTAR